MLKWWRRRRRWWVVAFVLCIITVAGIGTCRYCHRWRWTRRGRCCRWRAIGRSWHHGIIGNSTRRCSTGSSCGAKNPDPVVATSFASTSIAIAHTLIDGWEAHFNSRSNKPGPAAIVGVRGGGCPDQPEAAVAAAAAAAASLCAESWTHDMQTEAAIRAKFRHTSSSLVVNVNGFIYRRRGGERNGELISFWG